MTNIKTKSEKKMKYETVLFDLDGTLTDSSEGITNSVAYALCAFGYKYESLKQLECFIGPPLKEQFMHFCSVDEETGEKLVEKYREYYAEKGIYQNKLYKGADEMLHTLKKNGKKIVLTTSKPEKYAIIILKHFKIYDLFDFCAGALMTNSRTNKDEVIEYALENLENINKKTTIMVGDRMHDVIGASKHGIDTIGVLYGFGTRKELAESGAVQICKSVEELCKTLLQ